MKRKIVAMFMVALIIALTAALPVAAITQEADNIEPCRISITEDSITFYFYFTDDDALLLSRSNNTITGSRVVNVYNPQLSNPPRSGWATLSYTIVYNRMQGNLISATARMSDFNWTAIYTGSDMVNTNITASITGRQALFNFTIAQRLRSNGIAVDRVGSFERIVR